MRELVNWKDHVVEYPGRFQEEDVGNGLVQHTASPGRVLQQGTPAERHEFQRNGFGSTGSDAYGFRECQKSSPGSQGH